MTNTEADDVMYDVKLELHKRGIDCDIEYPGYISIVRKLFAIAAGTQNETWGADLEQYDSDGDPALDCSGNLIHEGEAVSDIPSDSTDVTRIADWIAAECVLQQQAADAAYQAYAMGHRDGFEAAKLWGSDYARGFVLGVKDRHSSNKGAK